MYLQAVGRRHRSRFTTAVQAGVAASMLAFAACGPYRRVCPVLPELSADAFATPTYDVIDVRFLGVAGFLLRRTTLDADGEKTDAVLTAPLYSNPTIGELAVSDLASDQRLIDALLPRVDDVQLILAGHSHYDHLLDVPYIARRWARSALICGSDMARDLLLPFCVHADLKPERIVSLESLANSPGAGCIASRGGSTCTRGIPRPRMCCRFGYSGRWALAR